MQRIGKPGVKYGLSLRGDKAKPKVASRPQTSFFDDGDDVDDGVIDEKATRDAQHAKAMKKAQAEHDRILSEDPNAFEYDDVYDIMEDDKKDQIRMRQKAPDVEKKSKYIKGLKEAAKQKERQDFLYLDRKLKREREADEAEFGKTEKFITGAYKRKLIEMKRWKEEDRAQEEREARQDPSKRGNMMGFYSNLLQGNVSMGAGSSEVFEEKEKVSEDRDSEKESKPAVAASTATPHGEPAQVGKETSVPGPPPPSAEDKEKEKEREKEKEAESLQDIIAAARERALERAKQRKLK